MILSVTFPAYCIYLSLQLNKKIFFVGNLQSNVPYMSKCGNLYVLTNNRFVANISVCFGSFFPKRSKEIIL